VKHTGSKVERANEELKGFKRISLGPGEKQTVRLALKASALAYWDISKGTFVLEPDQVNIMVGSSSEDIRLRATLSVTP
jgi:beta-glucosidase